MNRKVVLENSSPFKNEFLGNGMHWSQLLSSKDKIESILQHGIKTVPCLPLGTLKLLKLTSQSRQTADEIARIVQTDPTLTARVLQLVNSARFKLNHQIFSINHAVVLLGLPTIQSLAIEISVYDQFFGVDKKSQFKLIHFWRHCLSVATLAKLISEQTGKVDPQEIYIAGLLHDLGKLIIQAYGRMTYREFLIGIEKTETGLLIDEERNFLGIGHDEVGAYFCNKWGLSDTIVLSTRLHHDRYEHLGLAKRTNQFISIVALANYITWIQGIGSITHSQPPVLQPEVEKLLNLSKIPLKKLIRAMDKKVVKAAQFYDFNFPSLDQLRISLLQANINLSKVNTRYHYFKSDNTSHFLSLERIRNCMVSPHRSLDPLKIVPTTIKAIQRCFGFDRILLLKLNKLKRNLRLASYKDQQSKDKKVKQLIVPVTADKNRLILCLREHKPVLLSENVTGEKEILEQLSADEAGLIPVQCANKIIGLLVIDNHSSNKSIHFSELSVLSMVANELGIALEKAREFEEVRCQAQFDSLTKLLNRRSLDTLLTSALERAERQNSEMAIGLIDIDFFKKFNDNFGHLAGDNVLRLIAGLLNKFSRPTDSVGRFGGEEFMFILYDTCLKDAYSFAQRLRKEIESLGGLLEKRFAGQLLTVSIGVAAYDTSIHDIETLVKKADDALYRAKGLGRNRVVVSDECTAPNLRASE